MKNSKKIFLIILLGTLFTNLNLNCMDNSAPRTLENKELSFFNNIMFQNAIIFKGKCKIEGNGSYLAFTPNASITIAENSTLCLKNIRIKVDQETCRGVLQKIKLASNTSKILIEGNVTWEIENSFILDSGSFTLQEGAFLTICRKYTTKTASFIFRTPEKITLQPNSMFRIENVFFTYSPTNGHSNLIETGNKSIIQLVDSTIILRQNLQLIKTWVIVDGTLKLIAEKGYALILGDGEHRENNAPIDLYPGAKILNTFGETYDNKNVLYNNEEFYKHHGGELRNNNVEYKYVVEPMLRL